MDFGNIPEDVLYMTFRDFDEEEVTLKQMICEVTDQDILHAQYVISKNYNDNDYLASFTAWTEDHVLVLISSAFGDMISIVDRNYEDMI